MSHPSTRKSFLAKLAALIAVGGAIPKLFAKAASTTPARTPSGEAAAFRLERDDRAVARDADSV